MAKWRQPCLFSRVNSGSQCCGSGYQELEGLLSCSKRERVFGQISPRLFVIHGMLNSPGQTRDSLTTKFPVMAESSFFLRCSFLVRISSVVVLLVCELRHWKSDYVPGA